MAVALVKDLVLRAVVAFLMIRIYSRQHYEKGQLPCRTIFISRSRTFFCKWWTAKTFKSQLHSLKTDIVIVLLKRLVFLKN